MSEITNPTVDTTSCFMADTWWIASSRVSGGRREVCERYMWFFVLAAVGCKLRSGARRTTRTR